MKKLINPFIILIIVVCAVLVIFKLKNNGYLKPALHTTCHTYTMIKVSSDQARLTATHNIKQCDNTEYLTNIVSIKDIETKQGAIIYKSKGMLPETIYLIWEDFDGLVIAKPENAELISVKKYHSIYSVKYLPVRKLRAAIGNALTDHRNNHLNIKKPSD